MKFVNGELVATGEGAALFLLDDRVLAVGDKVDIIYRGPDRCRLHKVGHITITKMTFDPPEIRYGHHVGAFDFEVKADETIHIAGTT
jgi:hypothetical protein